MYLQAVYSRRGAPLWHLLNSSWDQLHVGSLCFMHHSFYLFFFLLWSRCSWSSGASHLSASVLARVDNSQLPPSASRWAFLNRIRHAYCLLLEQRSHLLTLICGEQSRECRYRKETSKLTPDTLERQRSQWIDANPITTVQNAHLRTVAYIWRKLRRINLKLGNAEKGNCNGNWSINQAGLARIIKMLHNAVFYFWEFCFTNQSKINFKTAYLQGEKHNKVNWKAISRY